MEQEVMRKRSNLLVLMGAVMHALVDCKGGMDPDEAVRAVRIAKRLNTIDYEKHVDKYVQDDKSAGSQLLDILEQQINEVASWNNEPELENAS